jgi:hypothetical protein
VSYRNFTSKSEYKKYHSKVLAYIKEEYFDYNFKTSSSGSLLIQLPEIDKHTLVIYICDGNYLSEVSEDYWEEVFAEDGELPKEIRAKLDELNKAIEDYKKPMSWSPSKYIAKFEWND